MQRVVRCKNPFDAENRPLQRAVLCKEPFAENRPLKGAVAKIRSIQREPFSAERESRSVDTEPLVCRIARNEPKIYILARPTKTRIALRTINKSNTSCDLTPFRALGGGVSGGDRAEDHRVGYGDDADNKSPSGLSPASRHFVGEVGDTNEDRETDSRWKMVRNFFFASSAVVFSLLSSALSLCREARGQHSSEWYLHRCSVHSRRLIKSTRCYWSLYDTWPCFDWLSG